MQTLQKITQSHLQTSVSNLYIHLTPTDSLTSLDIIEHDETYEAKLNLAGYKKEELDLSIHDHTLTVKTMRQQEQEQEQSQSKGTYLVNELGRSLNMTRSWKLPEHISENDITASFEDGLLRLFYSKHASSTPPKKITIS